MDQLRPYVILGTHLPPFVTEALHTYAEMFHWERTSHEVPTTCKEASQIDNVKYIHVVEQCVPTYYAGSVF